MEQKPMLHPGITPSMLYPLQLTFPQRKSYLSHSGQLPVIDENPDTSYCYKELISTPTKGIPNNSISTGVTPDEMRRRGFISNFGKDPLKVPQNPKSWSKTIIGEFKMKKSKHEQKPDQDDYFHLKDKIDEKYNEILNDIAKEELIETKHNALKNNDPDIAIKLEDIKEKYENIKKLIKMQKIMELEDLLKNCNRKFSNSTQPLGDI